MVILIYPKLGEDAYKRSSGIGGTALTCNGVAFESSIRARRRSAFDKLKFTSLARWVLLKQLRKRALIISHVLFLEFYISRIYALPFYSLYAAPELLGIQLRTSNISNCCVHCTL